MTYRIFSILAIPALLWMMPSETAFAKRVSKATSSVACPDGNTYTATAKGAGNSCIQNASGGACQNAAGDTAAVDCNADVKCTAQGDNAGCSSQPTKASVNVPTNRKPISSGAVTGKPGTAKSSGGAAGGTNTIQNPTNAPTSGGLR